MEELKKRIDNLTKIVENDVFNTVQELVTKLNGDMYEMMAKNDNSSMENSDFKEELSSSVNELKSALNQITSDINSKIEAVSNESSNFSSSMTDFIDNELKSNLGSISGSIEALKSSLTEMKAEMNVGKEETPLTMDKIDGLVQTLQELQGLAGQVSQPLTVDIYNGTTLLKSGVTKISTTGATYSNGVVTLTGGSGGSGLISGTGVLAVLNYVTTFSTAPVVGDYIGFRPDVNSPANATINGTAIFKYNSDGTQSAIGLDDWIGDSFYILQYRGGGYFWEGTQEITYTQTFNATTDWGAASGGYYTITIPASTHKKGVNFFTMFLENSGPNEIQVFPDAVTRVAANGDLFFTVSDLPDGRFAGKILIAGRVGGGSGGGGGSGTVTSVDVAFGNNGASPLITVSGNPITTNGTITLTYAPSTGWAMSNVTPDKVFDPTSTTLNETAMVLATLVDELKSKGILSA